MDGDTRRHGQVQTAGTYNNINAVAMGVSKAGTTVVNRRRSAAQRSGGSNCQKEKKL